MTEQLTAHVQAIYIKTTVREWGEIRFRRSLETPPGVLLIQAGHSLRGEEESDTPLWSPLERGDGVLEEKAEMLKR